MLARGIDRGTSRPSSPCVEDMLTNYGDPSGSITRSSCVVVSDARTDGLAVAVEQRDARSPRTVLLNLTLVFSRGRNISA
jgi:hypothetical protein